MRVDNRTLSEVGKLLEEIRDAGLDYTIYHPDRTWRVHIWSRKELPEEPSNVYLVLPSRTAVIDCLRAIVLGIRIGRMH